MNWKLIDRTKRIQLDGVYTAWKQQIAEDCYNQCVYCSIHESPWGGIDHYQIDHFRPSSKFSNLQNTITNLYYSCPICNKFKSDDWQNEPDNLDVICYPDPSDHNYSDLFNLDLDNYNLQGKFVSSRYVINRLYLNRPQLVYERRESLLNLKFKSLLEETSALLSECEDHDLRNQYINLSLRLQKFMLSRANITPYKLSEIRKK